jgi:hypothetical protein
MSVHSVFCMRILQISNRSRMLATHLLPSVNFLRESSSIRRSSKSYSFCRWKLIDSVKIMGSLFSSAAESKNELWTWTEI